VAKSFCCAIFQLAGTVGKKFLLRNFSAGGNCRQKVFVALFFSWRELSAKSFCCAIFQLTGTVGKKFCCAIFQLAGTVGKKFLLRYFSAGGNLEVGVLFTIPPNLRM
jgi:hypothetical protein